MAEGALFSVAGAIINSLAPLVRDEIGLLWGVQSELEKLQNTVTTIKNVVDDAEKRKTGSQAISGWLEQLSDVLYEADDLLDAVSTEAQRRKIMTRGKKMKKVRVFFSKSNQLIYGLDMGHKIKEMKEKFDNIAANINNFRFLENTLETRVINRKRKETHSSLGAETVIGREVDKVAVIDHLMDSSVDANVSIISIVGFGGLGKTALAKLIFHDEKIQKHFEVKIWVCVSDSFEVKDIIKKILEIAKGRKPQADLLEILVHDLKNEINGKKYLLVLDDVWNENSEKWFELKNQLMGGREGSKILATTRKEKVAEIMRSKKNHQLKGLEEQYSWELFKEVAFENGVVSESLEAMGKEILKKCKGVPLAIKTMGRLLYSEGLERWKKFINEELSTIDQEATDILPTLKLSYDDLSSHLKHCFAFCSLFPKDYIFDKAILINLWIAQGYVESEKNLCLEDIGNEYFMNLLWRSFFQEVQKDKFDNIIGCKMHDLMHDLAISMAGALIITSPFEKSINSKRIRHVAITYDISSFAKITPLYKASRTRTFLCPIADKMFDQVKIDCEIILKSFKFLRVLDLSGRKLKHVPSSISKLKHLRYLDLSWNKKIKKLPNSITTLVNLQNLCLCHCSELKKLQRFGKLVNLRHFDVSFCYKLRSLPRDITKLVNLRHLNIEHCYDIQYLPSGISQLTNLQLLSDFVVNSDSSSGNSSGLVELNGLNKLREHLTIRGLISGKCVLKEYVDANLWRKENLNSLCLEWRTFSGVHDWDNDESMDSLQPHQNLKCLKLSNYCCPRYPTWLPALTGLVSLSLNGCRKWRVLEPLSHLSSLQSLKLYKMNDLEYISSGEWGDYSLSLAPRTFFPSLKEIDVRDCPNLNAWWGGSSPNFVSLLPLLEAMKFFPSLAVLIVRECRNLKGWWQDSSTEVESLLCSFPLLSRVDIEGCPGLTSMPKCSLLKKSSLRCTNDSWKSLQQILMMSVSVTVASSPLVGSLPTHLSKLKKIEFDSVSDLEALPEEGLQSLTSLEILEFFNCAKLKSLSPGIKYLVTLQNLTLWQCPVFTGEEDGGMQWKYLKSLLHLSFFSLPNFSSLPIGLQYVTTLKTLSICECESFTTLSPLLQHLTVIEDLSICSVCIEDIDGMQWRSLKCLLSLSFSSPLQLSSLPLGLQHVTTLQNLMISNCENLTTLSPAIQYLKSLLSVSFYNLPKLSSLIPGLQHVTTLRKLEILSCESLTALSPVIKHFPTVEELKIAFCPMHADDKNEMQWHYLKSLLSLSFEYLPKLSSLPLGLKHVTTLRELKINGCDRMRTIPKWIRQCKSLEMLTIHQCSKLRSLPVGSGEPWSLQKLDIMGCPILLRKCERGDGKYWAKIAHIPDLQLGTPLERVSVRRRVLWKCQRVHRRVLWKCQRVHRRVLWKCQRVHRRVILKCKRVRRRT